MDEDKQILEIAKKFASQISMELPFDVQEDYFIMCIKQAIDNAKIQPVES